MLGGADRVLMATDDPYQQRYTNRDAQAFLASATLTAEDRTKIAHANAERLRLAPPSTHA